MRTELQSVLDSLQELKRECLPELLGELEVVRATVMLRLSVPMPGPIPPQHDVLIDIDAASQRLGMSVDYLYRHSSKFPFTRREGRNLRFSSLGIDAYLAKKKS